MIQNLKAFCIIYIFTPWVILFNASSKSIQNWKQKLIIWNDINSAEVSKLLDCFLRTFINLWLVCMYCSNTNLFLLTWVCSWLRFNILLGTSLQFFPNFRDQPWRRSYFIAKLAFIVGVFLKKYSWCKIIHFLILLLCNLKYISLYFIYNSMKGSCKYLIPFRTCHAF